MVAAWHPLKFLPYLRPMPWGGQRLAAWCREPWPADQKVGEVWLLSDHPHHVSVVAKGQWQGQPISRVLAEHGEAMLGSRSARFPLLFKLLDARENLSVQVHPDDELARTWAPGERGKTEAWVVLEADDQAAIWLGLKAGLDRSAVARELTRGTLPLCLQRYQPQPGQCYYVPAGTIHALGGGTVVFEVQQTSDATFRLYDWGRLDAAGRPRTLHLEAGLACLREQQRDAGLQVPRAVSKDVETLVVSPYFQLRRWRGPCQARVAGPAVWFTVTGSAKLGDESLTPGELAFLPAAATPVQLLLSGGAALLETTWEPSSNTG